MKEEILIVGVDSVIGSTLNETLGLLGYSTVGTTRRSQTVSEKRIFLDLDKPNVEFARYKHAFFCAAVTSIQDCEAHPVSSRQKNVDSTLKLAHTLAAKDCEVIYYSSNHVFDGKTHSTAAEAAYSPRSEYGRQKMLVEKEIIALKGTVLRLTQVLGPHVALFRKWVETWKGGGTVTAFNNFFCAPISLDAVVQASTSLLSHHENRSIYQLSALNDISYFDAACIGLQALGLPESMVVSSPVPEQKMVYAPPHLFSSLDASFAGKKLGIEPLAAESVVRAYFEKESCSIPASVISDRKHK